jgi:hypothetical protein
MKIKAIFSDMIEVSSGLGVEEMFAQVCANMLSDIPGWKPVRSQTGGGSDVLFCQLPWIGVCVLRDRTKNVARLSCSTPHEN